METQVTANFAPSTQSKLTTTISSVSTPYLCKTEAVVNEIDFKWTIERLAFFGSFGMCWESLTSPEFSDDKLKLDVSPYGDYLSIKLIPSNKLRYPITVEITFCDENCKLWVFAAMFQQPTKEVLSGQVEVEDVDPDVFQEVLRYMYTGLTQSAALDVMAPALLTAADKYLLDQLKTRCETHLIRQMSAKNCLDLLTLTTHHPAEHLKKFAIDYFRRYPSEVMGTERWKKMKEENPAALVDLQQMVFTAPTV